MALIVTKQIISCNRVTIPAGILRDLEAKEGDYLELEIKRVIKVNKSKQEISC